MGVPKVKVPASPVRATGGLPSVGRCGSGVYLFKQCAQRRTYLLVVPVNFAIGGVTQTALCIDEVAGRQEVDLPALRHVRCRVRQQWEIDAGFFAEFLNLLFVLTHAHRQQRKWLARERSIQALQARYLGDAGRTPGCPEIDQNDLSAVVIESVYAVAEIR